MVRLNKLARLLWQLFAVVVIVVVFVVVVDDGDDDFDAFKLFMVCLTFVLAWDGTGWDGQTYKDVLSSLYGWDAFVWPGRSA